MRKLKIKLWRQKRDKYYFAAGERYRYCI